MEFTQVLQTLTPITNFGETDDYNLEKHDFVTQADHYVTDTLLTLINNQQKVTKPSYSIFKQNYADSKFEHITDIGNKQDKVYHIVVNASDSHLILNILNPAYMAQHITKNSKQRFCFFMIDYFTELDNAGHRASLAIDNKEHKIYIVDPNGSTMFFNDIFKQDISLQVELMFDNYCKQLAPYNINYRFIYTNGWNPENISLNNEVNYDSIGDGHCLVVTLILANLMSALDADPIAVFKMLDKLAKEELMFVITTYTTAIYNIINNNFPH